MNELFVLICIMVIIICIIYILNWYATYLEKKTGVKTMPDRDGKGPRARSRYPSKKKGGRGLGKC